MIPVARKLWLPSLVSMPAADCEEQRPLGIVTQLRAVEISDEVFLEVMVTRHRVPLAAFLTQPHPEPPVLRVNTLDRHPERGANAGKRIDYQPDQRAIAQAGMGRHINIVKERALQTDQAQVFAPTSPRAGARAPGRPD